MAMNASTCVNDNICAEVLQNKRYKTRVYTSRRYREALAKIVKWSQKRVLDG
ncbi:hypothetical protein D3C77_772770 [compost metagenome]